MIMGTVEIKMGDTLVLKSITCHPSHFMFSPLLKQEYLDNCDLASTEKKARELMLYYPYMKVNIE
jgi:hypothetical protein